MPRTGCSFPPKSRLCTGRSFPQMPPPTQCARAAQQVQAVCELAGIKDLRAKVLGSHNPHTTIRAIFEASPSLPVAAPKSHHALQWAGRGMRVPGRQALDAVRTPEEISQMRGREVIRVDRPKTIAKRRWGMQI